jgi:hypothetical protein
MPADQSSGSYLSRQRMVTQALWLPRTTGLA